MGTMLDRLNRARIKMNCKLPLIQAQEVLDGCKDLHLQIPLVATHWETASFFDHVFLAGLVEVLKPAVSFEIGTSLGLVTATIACNSPASAVVHTLDLSGEARIGSFFHNRPENAKIKQYASSSTEFDFSPFAGKVDFMFVDGSHELEDVKRDSENAFRLLTKRGVIVWHDVTPYFPGVIQALESLPKASEIYQIFGTACAAYFSPEAPGVQNPGNAKKDTVATDSLHERA